MQSTYINRQRRSKRVRSQIKGKSDRFRLSVFRSNRYITAQIINDLEGKTKVSVDPRELKKEKNKLNKTELAEKLGALLAEKSLKLKIKEVIFDRGSFKFHGRIKAFAKGAREGGLIF